MSQEDSYKKYYNDTQLGYIVVENENNIFLIFRDFSNFRSLAKESITNNSNLTDMKKRKEKDNKFLTIVIDIDDFNKSLAEDYTNFVDIIEKFESSEKISNDINDDEEIEENNYIKEKIVDEKLNIIIKNCYFNSPRSLYLKDRNLFINQLYISDELYSISPNLSEIFNTIKSKKLILKKIKINSISQLNKFFKFISSSKCEELFLEDIFIELIIKKKEEDEDYNNLNKYFFYENGKIKIENFENDIKITKLKMIDCPLFAITDNTFKDINKYKDISIDIDENSLLNPSIITKFKINEGICDICFDLDSLKLNEDEEDGGSKCDYIKNIESVIQILVGDKSNEFNKLTFKNFDITKYEYITGENFTSIDEKNWVLNNEEKERKKNFEDFDEKINKEIENNKDILSKVKGLVFDNCTNYFIQLILKFINSTNNNLDILKLKKCGKEHFEIKNILNLKINKLILFDTPLSIDEFPKDIKGEIENLTININSLEHYCKESNLNYYKTLEIIEELIKNEKFNKNLCFEMNALPIIMTYLAAKEYHKIKKIKGKFTIPNYFEFKSSEERQQLIEKNDNTSPFIIEGLAGKDKTIILKNNSIKNKFENYDIIPKNTKNREQKIDNGRDKFDIDIDYRTFLNVNQIKTIIMEDCLINNYFEPKLKEESLKNNTLIN